MTKAIGNGQIKTQRESDPFSGEKRTKKGGGIDLIEEAGNERKSGAVEGSSGTQKARKHWKGPRET